MAKIKIYNSPEELIWNPYTSKLYGADGESTGSLVGVFRDDTKYMIGTCTESYFVQTNTTLLQYFKELNLQVYRIYECHKGETMIFEFKVNSARVGDDTTNNYFYIIENRNRRLKRGYGFRNETIRCDNQLTMLYDNAIEKLNRNIYNINKFEELKSFITNVIKEQEGFIKYLNVLASTPITDNIVFDSIDYFIRKALKYSEGKRYNEYFGLILSYIEYELSLSQTYWGLVSGYTYLFKTYFVPERNLEMYSDASNLYMRSIFTFIEQKFKNGKEKTN